MGLYGSPDLSVQNKTNNTICKNCKRNIESDLYNYCPYCGAKKGKHKTRWYIWVILFFSVLMIICNLKPKDNYTIAEVKSQTKDEFIQNCNEYTYEELARNPNEYRNKNIKVSGKVIQIQESGNSIEMRINITKGEYYYSDTIYCIYNYSNSENRILENDIVTIYGIGRETKTYTTVWGNSITLPYVQAQYIEINK